MFRAMHLPSRLPARHQRLPRPATRPASAERRRGQLRRGHRLSATPHPPGNGKAGRARPGPGIGRRPATGLGSRFRLCRPTAQDQRQRAHRIPRRRPVQATDRQRDPATGRTRPTLSTLRSRTPCASSTYAHASMPTRARRIARSLSAGCSAISPAFLANTCRPCSANARTHSANCRRKYPVSG